MHDPGRNLQRFAGETHARKGFQTRPLVAANVVEIGSRLVGKQHRLGVERVDEP
jgi:hypothetical protein